MLLRRGQRPCVARLANFKSSADPGRGIGTNPSRIETGARPYSTGPRAPYAPVPDTQQASPVFAQPPPRSPYGSNPEARPLIQDTVPAGPPLITAPAPPWTRSGSLMPQAASNTMVPVMQLS